MRASGSVGERQSLLLVVFFSFAASLCSSYPQIGDSSAAQRTRKFADDASQWRKGAMRSDDLEKAAKKIDNWWDKHHKKALAIARKRAGALLRDS
jgi:hypothetical protein